MDGNKTYAVMAATVAFGIFVFWNDYQQYGFVQSDAIKYVGGLVLGGMGLGTMRSAIKKLEG